MSEVLTILRRLLFSRVGCINRQKDECMELTGRVSLGVVLIVIIVAIIFW